MHAYRGCTGFLVNSIAKYKTFQILNRKTFERCWGLKKNKICEKRAFSLKKKKIEKKKELRFVMFEKHEHWKTIKERKTCPQLFSSLKFEQVRNNNMLTSWIIKPSNG